MVSIPWKALTQDDVITSGTLEFPSGEVAATIELPTLSPPFDSAPWIAFRFNDSPTASATGPSTLHFLDLPGGPTITETVLVGFGSLWSYLSDGSNQGTAWRDPDFDDSAWQTGEGQLGYGDGDEITDVGYTGTTSTKNATTYFRHKFEIQDPLGLSSLSLDLLFDDGAVIYLNGNRIASANIPEGEPAFDFFIGSTSSDNERETFTLAANNLIAGTNTLAIEIHQEGPSSSDISFDIEIIGIPTPQVSINTLTAFLQNDRFLFWNTQDVTPQTSSDLASWQDRPDLLSPLMTTPAPSSPNAQFFRLMLR